MTGDCNKRALNMALAFAAEAGQTKIVRALVTAGADVHSGRDQPLMWAAEHGHRETVEYLLTAGANPHGDEAAQRAAKKGKMDVVRVLLDWADRSPKP